MPRRGAVALLLTTAALALLLAFKTPSDPAPTAERGSGAAGAIEGSTPSPVAAPPAAGDAATSPAGAATTPIPEAAPTPTPTPATGGTGGTYRDGTLTGPAVETRWGTVQVQVTIAGGVIVDVIALRMPDGDPHSAQLSQRAEPRLRTSALAAQSGTVDVVSGATYTSRAYERSLQAALDSAQA